MRAFKVKRNDEDYFRVDLPKEFFTDGKRHSVVARTRREALDRARDVIDQRKKGLDSEGAKALLSAFLGRFLDYYKSEGGVALRTWQDYRYHIEENINGIIGGIALGDLKPRDVDQWLKSLRDRGLGNRTVEYAQAVLRRALQFAVEWEIIDRNPAAARFRDTRRLDFAATEVDEVIGRCARATWQPEPLESHKPGHVLYDLREIESRVGAVFNIGHVPRELREKSRDGAAINQGLVLHVLYKIESRECASHQCLRHSDTTRPADRDLSNHTVAQPGRRP